MSVNTVAPRVGSPPGPADHDTVSQILDKTSKPGTSISLGLTEGTVNVTLDGSGDWTIMVGLRSGSERILSTMFSLESLGFFRAAENDGTTYLVWTSALEDGIDGRVAVEGILFETLRALQRNTSSQYIS